MSVRLLTLLQRLKGKYSPPPYDSEVHDAESYYARCYLNHIKKHLPGEGQKLKLLDAGCGTGRFTMPLARLGHSLMAVDRSGPSLKILAGKAEAEGLDVTTQAADVEAFCSDNHSRFDAVLCLEVLYTSTDRAASTRQLYDCVKPGGLLFITHKPRHYFILKAIKEGHWDDALLVSSGSEGRLLKGMHRVFYNWQTSEEIEELYADLGAEALAFMPIGAFSGFGVDPLSDVCDPAALENEHRSALERLEMEAGNDLLMASRYVLAVLRKPA